MIPVEKVAFGVKTVGLAIPAALVMHPMFASQGFRETLESNKTKSVELSSS